MEYRIEKDTMGEVQVPAHVYWGAQTQRSIQNFPIAQDINKMPKEIIKPLHTSKKQLLSPIRSRHTTRRKKHPDRSGL
jgi:fumarate hydratase class II